jgi:tRNA(Ile)-lysidine synthase
MSLEAAGRDARYRFLYAQAEKLSAQAVAVGHTADDQVETILMFFLRGTGLRGLSGMPYRRILPQFHPDLPLVRPLLALWREDILRYCQMNNLTTLDDPTNQDFAFLRNRVRHELVPFMESYNPRLKHGILRMSKVLAGELNMVETVLDRHWDEILEESAESGYGFNRSKWEKLSLGIRRGLLLRALRQLIPEGIEIEFETIRRALTFLSISEHNGRITSKGGVQMVRRPERIWVLREGDPVPGEVWPALESEACIEELEVPGDLVLAGGWRLTASVEEGQPESWSGGTADPDEFQAWIDGGELPGPFAVRSRRAGDRFRPLGLGGRSQKLSDVMINERIPSEARDTWPLVEFKGEILWVPGYRLAHSARLGPKTRQVIHLLLTRRSD